MKKPHHDGAPAGGPETSSSVAAILRYQDTSGAFVASPDFSQYQYCWLRDGSFTAFALDRAGEFEASEKFHRWTAAAVSSTAPLMLAAADRQATGQPVDRAQMPPARFALDGSLVHDDWPNFQVDGYGTWLWALERHLQMAGGRALPSQLAPAIEPTATYLAALGAHPCYDPWEESGESVHTATLACVFGGLSAAGRLLDDAFFADKAEEIRDLVLDRGRRRGYFYKSDHNDQVDGALVWLGEPFHVVAPDDPALVETVRRVIDELDFDGGIRRYPGDTYYGSGAWPVLTASLGWHQAVTGDLAPAQARLDWVAGHVDDQGRLAEQFGGERRDPDNYQQWVRRWGPPAADLLWSHAMYIVLADSIQLRAPQTPKSAEPTGSALVHQEP